MMPNVVVLILFMLPRYGFTAGWLKSEQTPEQPEKNRQKQDVLTI